jgi:hypothetical protein
MRPPQNKPKPTPKQTRSFTNCGIFQIVEGIKGSGTFDSTKTNVAMKKSPTTRHKIIHHVAHPSGAWSASLIISIDDNRTHVNAKQNILRPVVTMTAPPQSTLVRPAAAGSSLGITTNETRPNNAWNIAIVYNTHRHDRTDVITPPRIIPMVAPTGFPAEKHANTRFFLFPGE